MTHYCPHCNKDIDTNSQGILRSGFEDRDLVYRQIAQAGLRVGMCCKFVSGRTRQNECNKEWFIFCKDCDRTNCEGCEVPLINVSSGV